MNDDNNLIKNGSLNLKEILRRICFGSIAGAFFGIVELWFFGFTARHAIAAVCAGAFFGVIVGLFGQFMSHKAWSAILLGAITGSLAGVIWWIIAEPQVTIIIPAIVGTALVCLMIGFERPWKET